MKFVWQINYNTIFVFCKGKSEKNSPATALWRGGELIYKSIELIFESEIIRDHCDEF